MSEQIEVILINMPFAPINAPSIGLGLLKAGLTRIGVRSKVFYFNVSFAGLIDVEKYEEICEETLTTDLAGEWVFTPTLFGPRTQDAKDSYLEGVLLRRDCDPAREYPLTRKTPESAIDALLKACERSDAFINACLEEVLDTDLG